LISGSLSGIDYIEKNLHWLPSSLLIISTVSAIVFGAISTALLSIIKNSKLLEKWMEQRSEAEELRLNYFKEISLSEELKTSLDYLTILEYFRRYQLDIQLNFFSIRTSQLEKKSNKALNALAVLSAIVLIINGLTGILGLAWSSLAAIAIILQNYAFMVNNKELNDQNTRNAERYSRTRSTLAELKSEIDDVTKSIMQDDTSILLTYIHAVQEQISLENRQWLKTMRSSSKAIDELETQLEKFRQKDDE
jgi:Mg2+ and Co2+ transporter CorA